MKKYISEDILLFLLVLKIEDMDFDGVNIVSIPRG